MTPNPPKPDLRPRRRGARTSRAPVEDTAASGETAALARLHHLLASIEDEAHDLSIPLDPLGAFEVVQGRINDDFAPTATALLELDAAAATWSPRLAAGCVLAPDTSVDQLPSPLAAAIESLSPVLVGDLSEGGPGVAPGSRCGIYVPLHVGGELVGAIALEHTVTGRFGPDDLARATQQASGWALTVDVVRRFGRVRTLVADATQAQVARDLHDRLGQWLTLVSMELEGVIRRPGAPVAELSALYVTVQSAIEEMRDTLRQALAGVAPDRPLARVAAEICERFEERSSIDVTFEATQPEARLPVAVEAELSRILMVALGNCERHAQASQVAVRWESNGPSPTLTIADDGVGFDTAHAIRDATGGLIDMRDRAAAIRGRLHITSRPGAGTTVAVTVPANPKERTC